MAASHVATCSSYSGRCSLPETGRHSAPTSSASSTRTGTTSWTLRFKLQPATLRVFQPTEAQGFHYIICTVSQCDLPPHRPHCEEARTEIRIQDGQSREAGTLTIRPPFIIFSTDADSYYKMQTAITDADSYYKCRQLLQMHTDITDADIYYRCRQLLQMQTVITNADNYYKCRQLLQMQTVITNAYRYYRCRQLLQVQTFITGADSYYKCIQLSLLLCTVLMLMYFAKRLLTY